MMYNTTGYLSVNRQSKMGNRKWMGLAIVALALVIGATGVEAQQPGKVFRIGYLSTGTARPDGSRRGGISLALRQYGYVEGKNIVTEYRHADGNRERLRELAGELVHLKVDVILAASGDFLIRTVMAATKTIPIIMTGAGSDPVEAGLIESLSRPGGNVTGITNLGRDLGGKRLELLKEAVPKIIHVAVLYEPASPPSLIEVKDVLPVAARGLKISIQPWEIRDTDGFTNVFAALSNKRPQALYVSGGSLMTANQKQIVGYAMKSRLPSMFGNRESVELGGLMCYGADVADSYRQVAWYVDKILNGVKPADLPVQQPMKFEFVINLQTAKKIGVNINTDVLARATKIIR